MQTMTPWWMTTPWENVRKFRNVPGWRKSTAELSQHCPCGVPPAGRMKYQDTKLSLQVVRSIFAHSLRFLKECHSAMTLGQLCKMCFSTSLAFHSH
jgi:hypothetical protein